MSCTLLASSLLCLCLPIPPHGVCQALPARPGCGHENPSLVSKVICIYHAYIVEALAEPVDQGLPFSLSTVVHHLAARPESLGLIAWLLHCCCSLAACAENMAAARPRLIVAMSTQACVMHAVLKLFVHDSLW
jgi:hypothetical protein